MIASSVYMYSPYDAGASASASAPGRPVATRQAAASATGPTSTSPATSPPRSWSAAPDDTW